MGMNNYSSKFQILFLSTFCFSQITYMVLQVCLSVCLKNQVELSSMRSDRKYSVEVQGVSQWGQTELKGPPAVLHFITQKSKSPDKKMTKQI